MARDEPNAFGREVRRRRLAQGLTLDALSAGADLTANTSEISRQASAIPR